MNKTNKLKIAQKGINDAILRNLLKDNYLPYQKYRKYKKKKKV